MAHAGPHQRRRAPVRSPGKLLLWRHVAVVAAYDKQRPRAQRRRRTGIREAYSSRSSRMTAPDSSRQRSQAYACISGVESGSALAVRSSEVPAHLSTGGISLSAGFRSVARAHGRGT
eukprot:CAMPEP_0182585176 /NCGR_PEP_ID=MMETSP1324-20130603/59695_1 /TAXON_ID=236786 /ORGANISM="Florenciella sp., Strain RCC1587" /LENGTH=116 /DNA_ID=CAMNT_0024801951 /DNA_START=15 /DNA_END=363 /DNA_ORIENTATION=+